MSVPYIAQKFQHNAIGIVSLKDPTIIIDIYSVLFTKCDIKNALLNKVQTDPSTGKYPDDTYEEQLSVYLDLTGVNPEYIPYITEHMYINGCPYADQNDHKQPVAVFELDFEQFELPLLTIKFNEMNPDYTFKMKFVFEHKKTTNNRDIKAEDFILYHVPGAYDTDYKEEHGNVINTQRSSYMLLRTNPALTGNIKMVCTTDGKMYLDTFKEHTHRSLSYRQYRKQLVGTDGNYPVDVFNVFSNLAPDILMNLDNDFLNAQKETAYTDIKDQYMTEYEYGVSENTDRLYDEDLKILAPLYIADNIPDYFIIFKADIDKIPNPASPESGIKINDSVITNSGGYLIDSEIAQAIYEQYPERYKDYINVSDIFRIMKAVKIFDLRPNTRLGNYLEKYRQQCQQYANKSLMASFVPVIRPWRAGCMRPNVQQDSFTVHGISYQHGNFNKVQRYVPLFELNEQGKVDKQFSMAYRMAGLLHPNIINLEYMFNDPDATDFKSYNYFGLYLTENQVLSISHVINAYKDGIYEGVGTDGNPVNIKDKLNPMLSHADSNTRLFSISSQDKVSIIHNITEISSFIKSNIVNIPGSMIGSPAYTSVNHIPMASFLTIKFTDKIKAGEHFKIIRPIETTVLSQHCQVIELIASNDERLKRYKKQHGRYLNTTGVRNTEFYQLPFYVSEDDTISDQLKRIQDCIRMIDSFVYISSITSDAIAFASEEKNLAFQHIMPPAYEDTYDYLRYYNCEHMTELADNHVHVKDDERWYSYNSPMYSTSLPRMSTLVNFMKTERLNGFYVYEITGEFDTYLNGMVQPLYYSNIQTYEPLSPINMYTNGMIHDGEQQEPDNISAYSVYTMVSPTDASKHYIFTKKQISKHSHTVKLYNSMGFNISALGITPVKDICTMYNVKMMGEVSSEHPLLIMRGSRIQAGKYGIQLFRPYRIKNGFMTPRGCGPGSVIMFINNYTMLYQNLELAQVIEWHSNSRVPLNATTDLMLIPLAIDTCGTHDYNVNIAWSKVNEYPGSIVPNLVSGWSGTSSSFTGIRKITPDNIKVNIKPNGYLNYAHFTKLQSDLKKQYCPYSLDEYVRNPLTGKISSLRNLILSGSPNTLNYFYKQYITPSIALYNTASNILEFVCNGIRYEFIFAELTNTFDIAMNFSTLDGYEAITVFDYKPQTYNELFISEDEKTILFVIHNLFINKQSDRKNNVIKVEHNDTPRCISMSDYFWAESSYMYDYINTVQRPESKIAFKHKEVLHNEGLKLGPDIYAYTQDGYPIYQHIADFNEPGYNITMSVKKRCKYQNNLKNRIIMGKNFDIFSGDCVLLSDDMNLDPEQTYRNIKTRYSNSFNIYDFFRNAGTYNDKKHEGYINVMSGDDNILAYDIVNKQDTRLYAGYWLSNAVISPINDHDYLNPIKAAVHEKPFTLHIIKGTDDVVSMDMTREGYPDIMTKVYLPTFPYSLEFVEPEKRDLMVFERGDSLLESVSDRNFTGANTHILGTLPLMGYVSNKVFDDKQNADISNLFNVMPIRDIFSNPWSHKSFVRISKQGGFIQDMPMYNAGCPIKCFFGSCAMSYPKTIKITSLEFERQAAVRVELRQKWFFESGGYTYNRPSKFTSSTYEINVIIDYTLLLTQYLQANQDFTSNWNMPKLANDSSPTVTAINNYINGTILPLYDLRNVNVTFHAGYQNRIIHNQRKPNPVICKNKLIYNMYKIRETINPSTSLINYQGHITGTYTFDDFQAMYIEFTINRY